MPASCYNYPQYWNLAFRGETRREADFIEAAAREYCSDPLQRLLEPACGGGRLVIELAARGYDVTGFDLSTPAIRHLARRLKRRGLEADIFVGDMTRTRVNPPVDVAFCTMNTFRHLVTERAACEHLQAIAESLRPGGLYILGFHLLPLDIHPESTEHWTARHGRTTVSFSLKVLDSDRRRRIEIVRFRMNVDSGSRRLMLQDDFPLRMYTATQFRQLLEAVPEFELLDVYDFWYEIDDPLVLDDEITDTVFVLRRRSRIA